MKPGNGTMGHARPIAGVFSKIGSQDAKFGIIFLLAARIVVDLHSYFFMHLHLETIFLYLSLIGGLL